jgi:DNA-binding beta-propeller fold protein YncE
MVVDVSGDTDESIANVGLAPVHAVQQTANVVLVVNHSVTGAIADSLTKLDFSSVVIGNTETITLPPNSAPNFVATTESSQAYVSLPGLVPPSVEIVNTLSNAEVGIVPVGNNPDAIAETQDSKKLYVANEGDSTVSAFNVVPQSLTTRPLTGTFNHPLWLISRNDSQRLYILNGNGVVSTIDNTSTAGPDTVIDSSITVPGATLMTYDLNLNRIYIPGGSSQPSQLTMLDVSQSIPVVLTGNPVSIATVVPSSRVNGDPCALTAAQPLTVAAVAALPDGSRVYVGSYYEDASDNICPQVTVIDVASNNIKSAIAVPGFPAYDAFCSTTRFRIMMAAAGDSSRAYLSSCDGGNVNIIDTTTDSYVLNLSAPISARNPIPPSLLNPPQNPVFLIAGP